MAQRGRRVFKKASINNSITVYLGRRDFFECDGKADRIDGMVRVKPDEFKSDTKVFARVTCILHYGVDDIDALGVKMRSLLYEQVHQVFPPLETDQKLTGLQRKLLAKLETNAFPFVFDLPHGTPSSVTLQGHPSNMSQPRCGVDWDVEVYASTGPEAKPSRKSHVHLAIRKLSFAPEAIVSGILPRDQASKKPTFGGGPITLVASLDRDTYFHGEPIAVHVCVDNPTKKSLKHLEILVRQFVNVQGEGAGAALSVKSHVVELKSGSECPIAPGQKFEHTYHVTPDKIGNEDVFRLALDGQLKDEDTGLASSTQLETDIDGQVGITVRYEVKVKVHIGLASDLSCRVPFLLLMPQPDASGMHVGALEQSSASIPDAGETDGYQTVPVTPRPRMTFDELEDMMEDDSASLDIVFEEFVSKRAQKFFSEQPNRSPMDDNGDVFADNPDEVDTA